MYRDDAFTMDLSAMVENQRMLEYLMIGEGPVSIKKPLPSLLKELHLNGLEIEPGQTTTEVFGYFPESVTRFCTYYVVADGAYDKQRSDMENAWMLILPRLKIRCQEAGFRTLVQTIGNPSRTFKRFFNALIEKHRLGDNYGLHINSIKGAGHNSISLGRVERLLTIGVPEELINYVIDGRLVQSGYYHSLDDVHSPHRDETYASATMRLIALGLTDCINLSKCLEGELTVSALPDAVVRNLLALIVAPSSIARLEQFLLRNRSFNIVWIDVVSRRDDDDDKKALLTLLHCHRERLPMLETIYFSSLSVASVTMPKIATEAKRLLAEMGLREMIENVRFSFHVGYGVAQFEAALASRLVK